VDSFGITEEPAFLTDNGLVSIFIDILYLLEWFLQEMLSYRLGTVNNLHWGFKPVYHFYNAWKQRLTTYILS